MTKSLCSVLPLLALAAGAQPRVEVTSPLGTKFYSLDDPKGVVAGAEKDLAADPRNSELLWKLAQAQISVWQDREGVETLTRALAVHPDDAALLVERGHRELPLREFARAQADLQHAARIDPKRMDAWYHLGLAHYFQGDFAGAADAFLHAHDTAPNSDEVINSGNWVYASLRRAGKTEEAARFIQTFPAKNESPHTAHYLNLLRLFAGQRTEAEILPPEPPSGNTDDETELRFDTVAYGIGNWHLYNGDTAKAKEYFQRVVKGHVWITWGFVGSEVELAREAGKQ